MTDLSLSPIYQPEWPAPQNVKAFSSYRFNGFSAEPYHSFNIAHHVGDNPIHVENNRQLLMQLGQLPETPRWLEQVHSNTIINSKDWRDSIEVDAIISQTPRHVCPIMTADCLPILLCNQQGTAVAGIHAGWRGLANNIIENTVGAFPADVEDVIVWLGPAIGPRQFEVGHDVFRAFTEHNPSAKAAFQQRDNEHFLADIYLLARQRLQQLGINAIYGGDRCTVSEADTFFSYRRDNRTGRMVSLIWLTDK